MVCIYFIRNIRAAISQTKQKVPHEVVGVFILGTLHLSSMKAARQTSLILLGTTTTNCFKASGTAKLSDWLTGPGSEVSMVVVGGSEESGPDTLMLMGSFKHTSANRVTPGTQQDVTLSVDHYN